ncbi:sigma-54-dependent transcriptional regulator [Ketogulonicigenium vulgare]|uniref:C4-dicarboxylate transport transcriptional regulatory protein DctD n=1 Tax=Ketogulonicigenium vulgare (strain WSH-001) TaxID=759362 RepID=F9Y3S7_KETVW|nr:sigma-54 dependent transcriptional regulator [Ketogulonicigenium vulgare]ADO42242.1 C4-dicarboxylate transport transcriptional regulatory protein DctD [Ketogulonicigenium vulgare Y25]AEM40441.1 C4-dicarboxylate transport transcriptional regulatory protein DctD [Ketogulonicigenium vulgare WSH-001]ALJ80630.1 Fis family transcriptional regulator [Ketogulonicigenium vulgare]ANW33446.1 Fis family transcriptional regulator [Ketogulonicigenium vulgare]AOZ54158.1 C4-dicarboxylate transport transcri
MSLSNSLSKAMKIAIVDDEKDMRQSISQWLALSGFDTEAYASAEEALKAIGPDFPGIVVSDVRMPGMDGMQFLKKLRGVDSALPVIMITGHGDVPMAVEAMRVGAFDFLEKPFNPDRMTELAKKASQNRRLTLDARALRRELSDPTALMNKLIGSSPMMQRLKEDILDLGQADGHVLIDGETGTGKTLVAHALHAVSARSSRKFVLLSCAAFDEETLTRRLFGPAAEDEPIPAMEEARGGTLVLEDVEALSQPLQARLLTVINEQGTPGETRIVAICNVQEAGKTCEDMLRPDLFYRLAALRITVPPLRARGEDILTLFSRLSEQFADEYGCDAPAVTAQEAAQLLQAPWPGNVRQLINVAERAVLQSRRGAGTIASLLMSDGADDSRPAITTEGKPLKEFVDAFERMLIDNTMRRHRGSIAAVMDELCLPRRTLNEKMAKYGLQRSDYL